MFETLRLPRHGLLAALLLGASWAAPAAASAELDLSRVAWTELHFKASKLMFKATAEIRLDSAQRGDVRADLIDPERHPWIDPSDDRNLVLRADSRILGRKSKARPMSQQAISRIALGQFSRRAGRLPCAKRRTSWMCGLIPGSARRRCSRHGRS